SGMPLTQATNAVHPRTNASSSPGLTIHLPLVYVSAMAGESYRPAHPRPREPGRCRATRTNRGERRRRPREGSPSAYSSVADATAPSLAGTRWREDADASWTPAAHPLEGRGLPAVARAAGPAATKHRRHETRTLGLAPVRDRFDMHAYVR